MPPVDGKIVGNATIWDYEPSELFYTPSFLTSKIYPYETIDTLDVESEITYLKESIVQRDTMDLSVALDVFTVRAPTYGTYDLPVDILTPSIALAAFSVRTVIYIPYTEDDDVVDVEISLIDLSVRDVNHIYYSEQDILDVEVNMVAFIVTTP